MIKYLLIFLGLGALPFACSDDSDETEEAIQMPGDEDDGTAGIEDEPSIPTMADDAKDEIEDPSLTGLADDATNAAANNGDMGQADSMSDTSSDSSMQAPVGSGSPMYVRCAVLRIRSGPGVNHETVGYLTFNAEVFPVESSSSSWVKIGEGKYIGRRFLSDQKNASQYIPNH